MQAAARTLMAGLLLVTLAKAAGAAIQCDVRAKYSCTQDGCQQVNPTVSNRFDPATSRYSRCDHKGCDDYDAVASRSGEFVNIVLPERGVLAKIQASDGGFVEVVTLGLTTLVSYGSCATTN